MFLRFAIKSAETNVFEMFFAPNHSCDKVKEISWSYLNVPFVLHFVHLSKLDQRFSWINGETIKTPGFYHNAHLHIYSTCLRLDVSSLTEIQYL